MYTCVCKKASHIARKPMCNCNRGAFLFAQSFADLLRRRSCPSPVGPLREAPSSPI